MVIIPSIPIDLVSRRLNNSGACRNFSFSLILHLYSLLVDLLFSCMTYSDDLNLLVTKFDNKKVKTKKRTDIKKKIFIFIDFSFVKTNKYQKN